MSLESLLDSLEYSSNRTKDRRLGTMEAIKASAAAMVPPGMGGGRGRRGGGGGMASGRTLNRKGFMGGLRPASGDANQQGGYGWASWAGDINVPGDETGNPVTAWKPGKVISVKKMKTSYGKHIRVRHPDGSETLYAHLSRIGVRPGQRVGGGQVIGKVGNTGNSTGPHLHFEIKK